jgi:precorrin-6B methylase 2
MKQSIIEVEINQKAAEMTQRNIQKFQQNSMEVKESRV